MLSKLAPLHPARMIVHRPDPISYAPRRLPSICMCKLISIAFSTYWMEVFCHIVVCPDRRHSTLTLAFIIRILMRKMAPTTHRPFFPGCDCTLYHTIVLNFRRLLGYLSTVWHLPPLSLMITRLEVWPLRLIFFFRETAHALSCGESRRHHNSGLLI
jgi:hypothetical protein